MIMNQCHMCEKEIESNQMNVRKLPEQLRAEEAEKVSHIFLCNRCAVEVEHRMKERNLTDAYNALFFDYAR